MNALGWQIGAVLIGLSSLIIAIYISKLLYSATKVMEKTHKIIDYNERYIHDIIENAASITRNTDEIMDVVNKITGITRIFRFIKR